MQVALELKVNGRSVPNFQSLKGFAFKMKKYLKLGNIKVGVKLLAIIVMAISAMTVGTLFALVNTRLNLIEERRNMTIHSVEIAQSLTNMIMTKKVSGQLSEEQAKKTSLDVLNAMRYDTDNYYFILDTNGSMISDPGKPQMNGTNVLGVKDNKGRAYYQKMLDVIAKKGSGIVEYSIPKANSQSNKNYPVITYVKEFKDLGWIVGTTTYVDDVNRAFLIDIAKFGALLFLAGIMYVAIGLYIGKDIENSLKHISDGIKTLTDSKDLHLTETDRMDEAGEMARGLVELDQKLRDARELEDLQLEAAQQKIEEQQKLEIEIHEFEAHIGTILQSVNGATQELFVAAERMNSIVTDVSQRAQEVASASSETSENVQTVASATEEMSASVNEISEQTDYFNTAISDAVIQMENADRTSVLLDQATKRIDEITDVIQSIAGQINMLALNATIESARAGEAGRGFAVVANEVKQLAGQTERATQEISQNITNIKEVASAVISALAAIKEAIESITGISRNIHSNVEMQTAATRDIARNMAQASSGTSMIDQSINEVSDFSLAASNSAGETMELTKTLSEQADVLSQEIKTFLQNVRAA